MPELIIIRGASGSGKTTLASRDYQNHISLEADMFHMNEGRYHFHKGNLSRAHDWCFHTCEIMLDSGKDVVVSNTFTRLSEMERYVELASKWVSVKVIRCTGEFENIHGVPEHIVENMRARMEDFEGEILH